MLIELDVNVALYITNIFIFILCGGLFIIMPQITRKSYLFGVKIPQDQSGCREASALKRNYTITCAAGVLALLAICTVQFAARRDLTPLASIYLPLLIVVINMAAIIPNWKKAVRLKETKGWRVSNATYAETASSHTRGALTSLPWVWYALSLLAATAFAVTAIIHYPILPDMIAGHLEYNLQPSYMVEKTWASVLMMPALNLATLAAMVFVAVTIEKAKLQISPENPRLSFAQHREYRRRMGTAMGFLTLVTVIFMSAVGLQFIFPGVTFLKSAMIWICLAVFIVSVVYLVYMQVKIGQGGCKIKIRGYENDGGTGTGVSGGGEIGVLDTDGYTDGDTDGKIGTGASRAPGTGGRGRDDDRFWLLGMFYFNRDDPACIVENRFGSKIGFNYARAPVLIGVALTFLGLAAMYVWMTALLWRL